MRVGRFTLVTMATALIAAIGVAVAVAGGGGAPRVTTLTGAENVGPTDPDGSGFASIRLNVGQQRVCWSISYQNLDTATASHIHRAAVGVNGPVVVPLNPNADGCVTRDRALIQEIIAHPERFYVNVHTTVYPGGAIRGQLSNPGQSRKGS